MWSAPTTAALWIFFTILMINAAKAASSRRTPNLFFSGLLRRQLHDAINRAKLDALWCVVEIDALDTRVRIDNVRIITDAH
jgi:hypothetical protein